MNYRTPRGGKSHEPGTKVRIVSSRHGFCPLSASSLSTKGPGSWRIVPVLRRAVVTDCRRQIGWRCCWDSQWRGDRPKAVEEAVSGDGSGSIFSGSSGLDIVCLVMARAIEGKNQGMRIGVLAFRRGSRCPRSGPTPSWLAGQSLLADSPPNRVRAT